MSAPTRTVPGAASALAYLLSYAHRAIGTQLNLTRGGLAINIDFATGVRKS